MKAFVLKYHDAPVAVSTDKWLLELFIVQRKLDKSFCDIEKANKEYFKYDSLFCTYYYGFTITNIEKRFIEYRTKEIESDWKLLKMDLKKQLVSYGDKLTKKDKKNLKNAIKTLDKMDLRNSKKHAGTMIDTILDNNGVVIEYLENLDRFRECMQGGF